MRSTAEQHRAMSGLQSVEESTPTYSASHMPKTFLGLQISAFFEIFLFLSMALLVDIFLLDNNRYITIQPHPFWIIVLLISSQYGTREGLLSVALSSIALLAWNIPEPQTGQNVYYHLLHISREPLMWLITAFVLGEIRMRHIRERSELMASLHTAHERENTLSQAYLNMKKLKEKLEIHIASELHSSINTYNAMRTLNTLNPSRTLLGIEEMVKAVLDPEKFSIYALGPQGLESAICTGWDKDETYSRRFPNTSAIYKEIVGRQRMLCCINDSDAKMLGSEGLIAAPLIDADTGNVFGMLKVEDIGFSKLTLSNVESFRILCEVSGLAHSNAEKYRQAEINSIIHQGNDLFSHAFFQQQCALFTQLANITKLTPVVISFKLMNSRDFSTKEKALLAEAIKRLIHGKILDVAQLFNGKKTGTEFHILLPSTSNDRLKFAAREIEAGLEHSTDPLLSRAKIMMAYHSLGIKKDQIRQVPHESE